MSPASPSITTTPSPTSFTLGTTTVTLKTRPFSHRRLFPGRVDHLHPATPGGGTRGYRDRPTVTATARTPRRPATPCPTTGTVTGTYQWDATYTSADGNNIAASETTPPVSKLVSPASPDDRDDAEPDQPPRSAYVIEVTL